jgi:hypothetical protein
MSFLLLGCRAFRLARGAVRIVLHGRAEGWMKLLLPLTVSVLMGAAFAQDPPPPPTQQQQPDTSITIIGCLTKGTMEGQYSLMDSKTGQKLNFTAAEPMDSYVNHTVQVTNNGSGDKDFIPQTVKTVSDTCIGGQ